MKALAGVLVSFSLLVLSGCGGSSSSNDNIDVDGEKAKLGEALFFDKNISLTRNTSCATCHNPEHGFVDARFSEDGVDQDVFVHGAFSVGDDGFSLGGRNAPTAAYAQFSPEFGEVNGEYKGGQFHDGRAASLKIQAMGPPLDGAEMQMASKADVVERLQENQEYITQFEKLYGSDIFDDVNATYEAMAEAIAKFEKTEEFAPFDSKYDRFKQCRADGNTTNECLEADNWTLDEQAGYALFFSSTNVSCTNCHSISADVEASQFELFTNFKYENIGTPRNIEAMNARFDLGLQDENATFLGLGGTVDDPTHYGKSKVPTLRNVAITGPYMSNGQFAKLRTVLEFYDHMGGSGVHPTNPESGEAWGNNDHPTTINTDLLRQNEMSDRKIRQLEAFLRTLTDKRYEHLLPELADEGEIGN